MSYTIVAGTLPPGVSLNAATGRIQGLAPDADLTYVFTVRATDNHGKFADSVFKIVVRGILIRITCTFIFCHRFHLVPSIYGPCPSKPTDKEVSKQPSPDNLK